MITSPAGARLHIRSSPSSATSVAVVFHGGSDRSFTPVKATDPAVLRLRPVAGAIARGLPTTAVYRLEFACRGWNGDGSTALRDARWALETVRASHPDLPIALVGHSMGGRVVLRLGGDPSVAGVIALAPWAPAEDPVEQLKGVPVIVIQGSRDRICPETGTRVFMAHAEAAGVRLDRTMLEGLGHTMVRRFWVWHRLARKGVARVLTEATQPGRLETPS